MEKAKQRWQQKSRVERASALLTLLGLLLIFYYIGVNWLPKWYRELTYHQSLEIEDATALPFQPLRVTFDEDSYFRFTYPTDRLFTTTARDEYKTGDLVLRVPRLAYEGPVVNGTSNAALKKGPGLYKYSPLPSFGNPNVCIAGHRGVYGAEFYKIDQIGAGDLLYLEYDGYLFTYEYVETQVVEADDWSMMYSADYSAITLSSCHPLSTSEDRMCVRGRLLSVTPLEGSIPLTQNEIAQGSRD